MIVQISHALLEGQGLPLHFLNAGHGLGNHCGAGFGLVSGRVGNVRRAAGILGHLQHGGVHFFHSRGGFGQTPCGVVQGPGGIFHLGGHIVDGSVELLHHPFYLVGGADHALALGAFGPGLSRAGLGHGLLGLCSFPAGRLSLRSGLSHQFAQICLHAAQRIGQQAHIVAAVHVQVQIALTLGHVLGITGNLGHRRTYHPPQHDRNGQLQHQQGTAHHDGLLDGGFFQTAQHVNGHAHKPHAHSLAVGGLDRPVGGIVRHAQNGVVGRRFV